MQETVHSYDVQCSTLNKAFCYLLGRAGIIGICGLVVLPKIFK